MTLTAEQKADIGRRYITAIQSRIDVRERAQKDAKEKASATDDGTDTMLGFAIAIIEQLGIKGQKAKLASLYSSYREEKKLHVEFASGITMRVPAKAVPHFERAVSHAEAADKLAKNICEELEFLHDRLDAVAPFQAHAGRLWAPASKDETASESKLKDLIETFLSAKRPVTCSL